MSETFHSRVYTDRPPYADFDAPAKFQAIESIHEGAMKIGLIDVDGHNFPNLALMRISAYHKSIGDTVEWWY